MPLGDQNLTVTLLSSDDQDMADNCPGDTALDHEWKEEKIISKETVRQVKTWHLVREAWVQKRRPTNVTRRPEEQPISVIYSRCHLTIKVEI